MTDFLERNTLGTTPNTMSGEEILDILFDKDDPLLKDIDCFMGDNITESVEQFPNLTYLPDENETNCDFWNSFLKDIGKDNYECTVDVPSGDSLETDSHYSESSSPRSSSSCCENTDLVETVCVGTTGSDSCIDMYPELHEYGKTSMIQTVSESSMDLGADVVVVTSEMSAIESSTHSIVTVPESVISPQKSIKNPTKGRRKRSLDEDSSFFDSVHDTLQLTEDELRLIKKEGLHIPTHLPLTRAEERELKRIRRKIRNKQSAQESRKRKKEYVDGLESRVEVCTAENVRLQKKVQTLETQQKTLLDQIKHLQSLLSNTAGKTVQTTTCLMVLFVSFAFLLLPSLFPNSLQSKLPQITEVKKELPQVTGPSRMLLSSKDTESQLEVGMEFPLQIHADIPDVLKEENVNSSWDVLEKKNINSSRDLHEKKNFNSSRDGHEKKRRHFVGMDYDAGLPNLLKEENVNKSRDPPLKRKHNFLDADPSLKRYHVIEQYGLGQFPDVADGSGSYIKLEDAGYSLTNNMLE